MWKYRYRGIFSEWNRTAIWIAFFVWLLTGFVIIGLDVQDPEHPVPKAVYAIPFVLAAAVILVRAILFRKEKQTDDEYLAQAVSPEWRRLPPDSEIIPKMQEACKTHILGWIILFVILMPGMIWALVRQHFAREAVIISVIVLLLLTILIGRNALRRLFWKHPPIELEYTTIDVAYYAESQYYVRGGSRKDVSLFFFLPSGKHRVVLHNQYISNQPPECVYFVRLHGIVHWIHWED